MRKATVCQAEMHWSVILNHPSAVEYFIVLNGLCMFWMMDLQGAGGNIRLLKRNEDLNSTHLEGPSNKVTKPHILSIITIMPYSNVWSLLLDLFGCKRDIKCLHVMIICTGIHWIWGAYSQSEDFKGPWASSALSASRAQEPIRRASVSSVLCYGEQSKILSPTVF